MGGEVTPAQSDAGSRPGDFPKEQGAVGRARPFRPPVMTARALTAATLRIVRDTPAPTLPVVGGARRRAVPDGMDSGATDASGSGGAGAEAETWGGRAAKPLEGAPLRVEICLEVGSGSGVVSTFLASMIGPQALYMCTDINPEAAACTLETARCNRVHLQPVITDLVKGLLPRLKEKVDLLVFNPPYVVTPPEEVGSHGIQAAWAGGRNGREVMDRFFPLVPDLLSPRGLFYLVTTKENNPGAEENQLFQPVLGDLSYCSLNHHRCCLASDCAPSGTLLPVNPEVLALSWAITEILTPCLGSATVFSALNAFPSISPEQSPAHLRAALLYKVSPTPSADKPPHCDQRALLLSTGHLPISKAKHSVSPSRY
ncbi:methyltransferase N6AMT1 isoform X2 [Saccopteryx bilineata]|uniref:methyltransferase N6AMT1 isoform X2 n=1 Tax=Saccopteryx bilineata TaxID=59482 RepID=UPI0033901F3F